ncbi:unnamed protein product [Microthlaspi erraticum]|uniref:TFIIS N-terminal domain-containing protein n=1 Tax=Microthlaspi erraticum TaxID=1685480 RepID=A0A6D2JZB0_9BRAS|nr:unnamed protein product [Microthlaspi erraticum]CAA7044685.1 unnamed protein product [Microthlaspi erraticum]
MMMEKSMAIASERSGFDFDRLVCAALRDAESNTIDGVEGCFDILRYLNSLNLSAKDLLRHSRAIHSLQSLRDHENPRIRMGAVVLFNSWMKTLYYQGRDNTSSFANKAVPLKKQHPTSHVVAAETKQKSESVGFKKNETEEAKEIKRNLKKPDVCKKSVPTKPRPRQIRKQTPLEDSESPNCQALKKNSTEMVELFEIAKKSADVANTKGLLLAKAETSICVETLSLLISFPISSTAPETRRIMERLVHLTRHKDRKVCSSASSLLQHWSQSIRDQQRQDSKTTTRK